MMPYEHPTDGLGFRGLGYDAVFFLILLGSGSECVRLETGTGSGFSFGVLKRWVLWEFLAF